MEKDNKGLSRSGNIVFGHIVGDQWWERLVR